MMRRYIVEINQLHYKVPFYHRCCTHIYLFDKHIALQDDFVWVRDKVDPGSTFCESFCCVSAAASFKWVRGLCFVLQCYCWCATQFCPTAPWDMGAIDNISLWSNPVQPCALECWNHGDGGVWRQRTGPLCHHPAGNFLTGFSSHKK